MAEVEGSSPSVPILFPPKFGPIKRNPKGHGVTEKSVLEQVRHLVSLQQIDTQIYQIRKELQEKPALLQKLKEDFESQKEHLKELEDGHKGVLLKRKGQEVELQAKEDAVAKANAQLSQIKTNKEYTAKITEIENMKADKSLIEEKILLFYDEADQAKAAIDKEKEVVADKEKEYNATKQDVENEIKALNEKLKDLQAQRAQITPPIDKIILERYEKILANKEGMAIVPVQGDVCGGCYMNVPAQVINEMKMHEKMIFCELCARILYLEEDIEKV